jgi:hypothetical protein
VGGFGRIAAVERTPDGGYRIRVEAVGAKLARTPPFPTYRCSGLWIDSPGDLDGDGSSDLFVIEYDEGTPRREFGTTVHALSGTTGEVLWQRGERAFPGIGPTFDPDNAFFPPDLGWSSAVSADINDDGVAEILVSAPGFSHGAVFVLSGASGRILGWRPGPSWADRWGSTLSSDAAFFRSRGEVLVCADSTEIGSDQTSGLTVLRWREDGRKVSIRIEQFGEEPRMDVDALEERSSPSPGQEGEEG